MKFCGSDGAKLTEESETEIERGLDRTKPAPEVKAVDALDFTCTEEAFDLYQGRLRKVFGSEPFLKGFESWWMREMGRLGIPLQRF